MEEKENDWYETFSKGGGFENLFLKQITAEKYPLSYKNMDKNEYSYYDIILFNGKFPIVLKEQIKVECKFDEMAFISKNICIEVGCNGRLSGLLITMAQYWVITDGHTVFVIKPDEIRRCLIEHIDEIEYKKKHRVTQKKGEYKEMDLYIIPRRMFDGYCCEIGDINNIRYNSIV